MIRLIIALLLASLFSLPADAFWQSRDSNYDKSIGGFTPLNLPNLLAWYQPSGMVNTGDGTNITSWTDSSGNGNTITPFNAVTYKASGIGGVGTSNWTAGAAQYFNSGSSFAIGTGNVSVFAVVQINASVNAFVRIVELYNGSVENTPLTLAGANNVQPYFTGPNISATFGNNYRLGSVTNGSTITGYKNGASQGTVSYSTAPNSPTTLYLGIYAGNLSSDSFVGYISEVVITTGTMSATDVSNLDTYFTNKYGSTWGS